MQSIHSLAKRLSLDFPDVHFSQSKATMWEPSTSTVHYSTSDSTAELLHELGHAVLGHNDYNRDIVLLGYERDAWQKATGLADTYDIQIDEDGIQDHLDTYRSWLHARSVCPSCQSNGVQILPSTYQCIDCRTKWTVNEARTCALRRRTIK